MSEDAQFMLAFGITFFLLFAGVALVLYSLNIGKVDKPICIEAASSLTPHPQEEPRE